MKMKDNDFHNFLSNSILLKLFYVDRSCLPIWGKISSLMILWRQHVHYLNGYPFPGKWPFFRHAYSYPRLFCIKLCLSFRKVDCKPTEYWVVVEFMSSTLTNWLICGRVSIKANRRPAISWENHLHFARIGMTIKSFARA